MPRNPYISRKETIRRPRHANHIPVESRILERFRSIVVSRELSRQGPSVDSGTYVSFGWVRVR